MLAGSSAIKNEPSTGIVSPKVSARIYENYYQYNLGASFVGLSLPVAGVRFNDYFIFLEEGRYIKTFNKGGSLVSTLGVSVVDSGDSGRMSGDFHIEGSTLYCFVTQSFSLSLPGNYTPEIDRLHTSNGVSWSGFTNVYSSGLGAQTLDDQLQMTSSAGISRIYGISEDDGVYCFYQQSGKWGRNKVYDSSDCYRDLVAVAGDNMDYLVITAGGTRPRSFCDTDTSTTGLRLIESDERYSYLEEDLIDTQAPPTQVRLTNIARGASEYRFGAKVKSLQYLDQGVVTYKDDEDLSLFTFRSANGKHWSSEIYTGSTFCNTALAIGRTSSEYDLHIFTPYLHKSFNTTLGSSYIDISDDIISYSNNNNDFINLRLGNKR